MPENELKACVSGSFKKFKPEIDLAIEELNDLGVIVLAPDKGWVYIPIQKLLLNPKKYEFRHLASEKGMSFKEVEDNFLSSIKKSDFLYVINPHGYIGDVVSLEIGFTYALDIPIFLQEKSSRFLDLEEPIYTIMHSLKVCTIQEAVAEVEKQNG